MATDPLKHHDACLTPAERFALTSEAMARGDETEADRLEDACPKHSYHLEDPEYRDRMKRAYMIALMVCLNMREKGWPRSGWRRPSPRWRRRTSGGGRSC